MSNGKKETQGKLSYEISWEFVEGLAKRMESNKGKYEPYNWKKKMDIQQLKQSLARHFVSVMKGEYKDGDEELGHLYALACNVMFIVEQLNQSLYIDRHHVIPKIIHSSIGKNKGRTDERGGNKPND